MKKLNGHIFLKLALFTMKKCVAPEQLVAELGLHGFASGQKIIRSHDT